MKIPMTESCAKKGNANQPTIGNRDFLLPHDKEIDSFSHIKKDLGNFC